MGSLNHMIDEVNAGKRIFFDFHMEREKQSDASKRALSYIVRNASALGVGTGRYSVWGSSAGARMAAAIGSHGVAGFGGDALAKPSAVVMAYTGHSDHSTSEPPTFAVVGEQDRIAPPVSMERRIAALRKSGTQVEYHVFPNVGHGFGPGIGTSASGWIGLAMRFWERASPGPTP